MSDRDVEARIRDLEKRVELQPRSRFFVPLAEEYRRAGRLPDSIRALEAGLAAHPGYVAARIALARSYLEAGRIEESMAAFSRALGDDPGNLVAAKALADLHLSRGEPAEALARYRLYRDIGGDRRIDELIVRLEAQTAPPPAQPSIEGDLRPTPPFAAAERSAPLLAPDPQSHPIAAVPLGPPSAPAPRPTDPGDITSVPYRRPSGPVPISTEAPAIPSRDLSLDALSAARRDASDDIVTRKIRLPEATWPFGPAPETPPAAAQPPAPRVEPQAPAPPPSGRTLADLYFEQGHYAEAAEAYGALLASSPSDEELRRLREAARTRTAERTESSLPAGDPGRERRLAKIAVLNEWIDVVKTSAGNRETGIGNRADLDEAP